MHGCKGSGLAVPGRAQDGAWAGPGAEANPTLGGSNSARTRRQEQTQMTPRSSICFWFDKDAHEAARFDVATIEAARQG